MYSFDAAAHLPTDRLRLSTYFLRLRGALDREKHPTLIVDLTSGYILSLNLPAFELLKINAVGLWMTDFAANEHWHREVYQELRQTKNLMEPSGSVMQMDTKWKPRLVPKLCPIM
ncbi:MAG: hypothetical protein HC881_15320 [Leptolyngbyaceae cyanobacterium SL_7_1]|nr:hypothetical protein [Leptolyngbyaceae cyanobacterium SL_7_1]